MNILSMMKNKRSLRVINHIKISMLRKRKKAFTLTEVLIAVIIVGIIAALVLPTIITHYQTKAMELKGTRQLQAIQAAVSSLAVLENKTNFTETMLYSDTTSYSADDTAGKFLKKYFKIAKYCGAPTAGKSECFADEYYEYSDKDKKVIEPELEGACAILKNGVSVCVTPQVIGEPVKVVMDLNGPKGPNIMGEDRDFRKMTKLDLQYNSTPDKVRDPSGVLALNNTPIEGTEESPCTSLSDTSTVCCRYRSKNGQITSKSHVCCANPTVGPTEPKCLSKVTVHVNIYPTGGTTTYQSISPTQMYINASSSTYTNPADVTIPSALALRIKCASGYPGPGMSASTLNSALTQKSGNFYFDSTVTDKSCLYNTEQVLWNNNMSTSYTYDGVTYEISKH